MGSQIKCAITSCDKSVWKYISSARQWLNLISNNLISSIQPRKEKRISDIFAKHCCMSADNDFTIEKGWCFNSTWHWYVLDHIYCSCNAAYEFLYLPFLKKKEKEKMVCVQRNSIKKWSCVQVCVATQLCSAHEGANWEMSCEGKTYARWSFSCAECVLQVCKEDGY